MRNSPSQPYTYGLTPLALEQTFFAADARLQEPIMADDPSIAEDPSLTLLDQADGADDTYELSPEAAAALLWEEPTQVVHVLDSVHAELRAELDSIVDSASQQLLHMNHAMLVKGLETRRGVHQDILKVADEIRNTVEALVVTELVATSSLDRSTLEKKIFSAANDMADLYSVSQRAPEVRENISVVRGLLRFIAFRVAQQMITDDASVVLALNGADARNKAWKRFLPELEEETARFGAEHETSVFTDAFDETQTKGFPSQMPVVPPALMANYRCSNPACTECQTWDATRQYMEPLTA